MKKLILLLCIPFFGIAQTDYELAFNSAMQDYVEMPNASAVIANKTAFSISCWVNPQANTTHSGIMGFRNNTDADFYLLQLQNTNNVEARFRNSSGINYDITATNLLDFNQWQHLVFTYDGSNINLYKDGVLISSTPANGMITQSAQSFRLAGLDFQTDVFHMNGRLDEVRLWDVALSQTEINNWMCIPIDLTHPNYNNLMGYWPLNEGTGITITDLSINSNNGTLINNPVWQPSTTCFGNVTPQLTSVPDDNFENYLEANGMGDGIALNDNVFTSAIDTLTYLDVSNQNIADLTGIEDFTTLTALNFWGNQLTNLDISNNTALTYLECNNNQLTTLDVSNNTALTTLNCHTNQLTSLDVSSNTALTTLWCQGNQLSNLDVSNNTVLTTLDCSNNQLNSLNLNGTIALIDLWANHNQLTSLDISTNTVLTTLECNYNQLTILDVRNGNNTNMITFWAFDNLNLFCIDVDDAAWSTANWTVANGNIDPQSSFSLNCIVPGCTDTLACNYDLLATVDDSSCMYLDIIAVPTSVSCFGMFDGSISATATGGTFPLQYSLGAGLSQTNGTFSNLSAGTYYIDVTDANNCTSNQMVIITTPAALSISVDSTDETSALNDGSVTAVINGGTAPYIYTWNNGIPSVSAQTTNLQVNLAPGLYTIVVTDANGCVISDSTSMNAYNPTSVINIKNPSKTLIKVTDMLGQETPSRRNAPLFYIYDDGTVEKQIIIE